MLNNSLEREDRLQPFLLCSLSVYFLFHSSFSRKEEKEKVDKKTAAKDIFYLTIVASLTLTDYPLFLWQLKAQRKSLAKRNADWEISPLRRREGVRRLHLRQAPLKRGLDSPNKKAKTSAKHLRF